MKETNGNWAAIQQLNGTVTEGKVDVKNGLSDVDRKHALVVSLLSMLQAPAATVLVPSFGDRNQ